MSTETKWDDVDAPGREHDRYVATRDAITDVLRKHDLMSSSRCACGVTFEPDEHWTAAYLHVAEQVLKAEAHDA